MAEKLNKDTVYRTAKAKEKDYSISDGNRLALHINTKGSKLWRFVYTFDGKRCKMAFGNYPATSLELARKKADNARDAIANGINPANQRKAAKQSIQQKQQQIERIKSGLPIEGSFADAATQWLNTVEHLTKPQTHIKKANRLKSYAFPAIGDAILNEVKSSEIMALLKLIPTTKNGQFKKRVIDKTGFQNLAGLKSRWLNAT